MKYLYIDEHRHDVCILKMDVNILRDVNPFTKEDLQDVYNQYKHKYNNKKIAVKLLDCESVFTATEKAKYTDFFQRLFDSPHAEGNEMATGINGQLKETKSEEELSNQAANKPQSSNNSGKMPAVNQWEIDPQYIDEAKKLYEDSHKLHHKRHCYESWLRYYLHVTGNMYDNTKKDPEDQAIFERFKFLHKNVKEYTLGEEVEMEDLRQHLNLIWICHKNGTFLENQFPAERLDYWKGFSMDPANYETAVHIWSFTGKNGYPNLVQNLYDPVKDEDGRAVKDEDGKVVLVKKPKYKDIYVHDASDLLAELKKSDIEEHQVIAEAIEYSLSLDYPANPAFVSNLLRTVLLAEGGAKDNPHEYSLYCDVGTSILDTVPFFASMYEPEHYHKSESFGFMLPNNPDINGVLSSVRVHPKYAATVHSILIYSLTRMICFLQPTSENDIITRLFQNPGIRLEYHRNVYFELLLNHNINVKEMPDDLLEDTIIEYIRNIPKEDGPYHSLPIQTKKERFKSFIDMQANISNAKSTNDLKEAFPNARNALQVEKYADKTSFKAIKAKILKEIVDFPDPTFHMTKILLNVDTSNRGYSWSQSVDYNTAEPMNHRYVFPMQGRNESHAIQKIRRNLSPKFKENFDAALQNIRSKRKEREAQVEPRTLTKRLRDTLTCVPKRKGRRTGLRKDETRPITEKAVNTQPRRAKYLGKSTEKKPVMKMFEDKELTKEVPYFDRGGRKLEDYYRDQDKAYRTYYYSPKKGTEYKKYIEKRKGRTSMTR